MVARGAVLIALALAGRLSWLWGEGVPSRVARGAPNSAAAARDDLAPAYPTLNM